MSPDQGDPVARHNGGSALEPPGMAPQLVPLRFPDMGSYDGHRVPTGASADPALQRIASAFRAAGHGPNRVPFEDVVVDLDGVSWSAGSCLWNYKVLRAAISVDIEAMDGAIAAIQDQGYEAGLAYGGTEHEFANEIRSGRHRVRSGATEEYRVDLDAVLRAGLHFGPPRQKNIPKCKFADIPRSIAALPSRIMGPVPIGLCYARDPKTGKPEVQTRTLVIAPTQQRILAGALQILLSAYLAERWKPSVVGYRPGIGVPTVLATLRSTVAETGRGVLLFGDFSGFFDSIPRAELKLILRNWLGLSPEGTMERYIDALLGPGKGLPQGNPLSPLFSNMYAAHRIDSRAWTHGPYMRYADDFVLALKTKEDAVAALQALTTYLPSTGLSLHPQKCQILDLNSHLCWNAWTQEELPVQEHLYLGARMQLAPSSAGDGTPRLRYALHWSKLWQLAAGIQKTWIGDAQNSSDEFVNRITSAYWRTWCRIQGWLFAFGGLDWSEDQEAFFGAVLYLGGMTAIRPSGPLARITVHGTTQHAVDAWTPDHDSAWRGYLASIQDEHGKWHRIEWPWNVFTPEAVPGLPEVPLDWNTTDCAGASVALDALGYGLAPVVHSYLSPFRERFSALLGKCGPLDWAPPGTPVPLGQEVRHQIRNRGLMVDTGLDFAPCAPGDLRLSLPTPMGSKRDDDRVKRRTGLLSGVGPIDADSDDRYDRCAD